MKPATVNSLLQQVQELRAVGAEELFAVAVVNGRVVRFAVIAISPGDNRTELVLELERRSMEGFHR